MRKPLVLILMLTSCLPRECDDSYGRDACEWRAVYESCKNLYIESAKNGMRVNAMAVEDTCKFNAHASWYKRIETIPAGCLHK